MKQRRSRSKWNHPCSGKGFLGMQANGFHFFLVLAYLFDLIDMSLALLLLVPFSGIKGSPLRVQMVGRCPAFYFFFSRTDFPEVTFCQDKKARTRWPPLVLAGKDCKTQTVYRLRFF